MLCVLCVLLRLCEALQLASGIPRAKSAGWKCATGSSARATPARSW
jgi:hypothetical protein